MRNPSYRQAEWIHKNLAGMFRENADDVYDVLLGNVTVPEDFVNEVKTLAIMYEDQIRRQNGR